MAASIIALFRNYSESDNTENSDYRADQQFPSIETLGWERDGYEMVSWNTSRDGSGTSYAIDGYPNPMGGGYFAQWRSTNQDYIATSSDLTSVANAIRVKAEITGSLVFPVGFIEAVNSISPKLQEKTVTPTQNTQIVEPDSGKDGLSRVTVNPIPSNYGLITWNGSVLTVS